MIVKVKYARPMKPTEDEQKKLDTLREAHDKGADLAPSDYEFLDEFSGLDLDFPVVAKLIDCEEIIVFEGAEEWGFTAYREDKNMGKYKFPMKSKHKVYIMVEGKTVDTLPRR